MTFPGLAPGPSILDDVDDMIRGGLRLLAVAFTNAGTAINTALLNGGGTAPQYVAWGTGTTAAAVTDTDLQTESAETLSGGRVAATQSVVTGSVTNDTNQYVAVITATGARAITEIGNFTAQSVGATVPNAHGNLQMHAVFAADNLVAGDSLQATLRLKQVAGVF